MCVGSPTAGTLSSTQQRPDDEFETDTHVGGHDGAGTRQPNGEMPYVAETEAMLHRNR